MLQYTSQVVTSSFDGSVCVVDVDTGACRKLSAPPSAASLFTHGPEHVGETCQVLPDGRIVTVCIHLAPIAVWCLRGSVWELDHVLPPTDSTNLESVVLRDGLAVLMEDRRIQVRDLQTGAVLGTIQTDAKGLNRLAVLPDSRFLLTNGKKVGIWTEKGKVASLVGHTLDVTSVAVMPDGRVVTGSQDKTVRLWSESDGVRNVWKTDEVFEGSRAITKVSVLSKDCLAVMYDDDAIWMVYLTDERSRAQHLLSKHTNGSTGASLLRDGRLATSQSYRQVHIWELGYWCGLRSALRKKSVPVTSCNIDSLVALPVTTSEREEMKEAIRYVLGSLLVRDLQIALLKYF